MLSLSEVIVHLGKGMTSHWVWQGLEPEACGTRDLILTPRPPGLVISYTAVKIMEMMVPCLSSLYSS
jgi:hypothetical protein